MATATAEVPQNKKAVPFTADRYPNLKRDKRYKQLDAEDVAYFKSIISSSAGVITADNPEELDSFNEVNIGILHSHDIWLTKILQDWMRKYKGRSTLVLRPKTTAEVSAILRYCNEKSLAVVPQGGNTGLVGGSIPVHDEIVLSTQLLNQIRHFDEVSGILTAEAGCVLEVLDNWLAEKGYMMPLGGYARLVRHNRHAFIPFSCRFGCQGFLSNRRERGGKCRRSSSAAVWISSRHGPFIGSGVGRWDDHGARQTIEER